MKEKRLKSIKKRNGVVYTLTDKSRNKLHIKFPNLFNSKKKWDGLWRIVVFDIKEKLRHNREFLRRRLKEYSFYQLQKSVWISLFGFPSKIMKLIQNSELGRDVIFIETKTIETKNNKDIITKILSIEKINKKYDELYSDLINLKKNAIPKIYDDRHQFIEYLKSEVIGFYLHISSYPKEILPGKLRQNKLKHLIRELRLF